VPFFPITILRSLFLQTRFDVVLRAVRAHIQVPAGVLCIQQGRVRTLGWHVSECRLPGCGIVLTVGHLQRPLAVEYLSRGGSPILRYGYTV